MTSDHEQVIKGLDGPERQAVAAALWDSWRSRPRRSSILTGLSGVGKSRAIVGPLLDRAEEQELKWVLVEAPIPGRQGAPADVGAVLLDDLRSEMEQAGIEVGLARGLFTELRQMLRKGVLVVIDEFQRLLDPDGRPIAPFAEELATLVSRPNSGALWLLSNRTVDLGWAEPFHVATLPAPQVPDAISIVVGNMSPAYDPEEWFPAAERERAVERLGANPRVLRLLGALLGRYTLHDLLGPATGSTPDRGGTELVDAIEVELVQKATDGLPEATLAALKDLSVLDGWADAGLREAMIGQLGDAQGMIRELLDRYLLETRPVRAGSAPERTSYRVHPVVHELNMVRRHGDEKAWRAAHLRAAQWYARPLRTRDLGQVNETRLAAALGAVEQHLEEAQAGELSAEIEERVGTYLARYEWERRVPTLAAEQDGRIALLSSYLATVDAPALSYHLAHVLMARGGPNDGRRAVIQAERATRGQVEAYPWVHWIKVVRQVEGFAAAAEASRRAVREVQVHPARAYVELGAALAHDGRPGEAVAELRKGFHAVAGERYRLAQHAVFYAAGETDPALLTEVRDWLRAQKGLQPQAMLAEVLLLQHRGRWRESVERARAARAVRPLVHLSMCEAMGYLAVGEPAKARSALAQARTEDNSERRMAVEGKDWLAALIELMDNRARQASRELTRYMKDVPTKPVEIRNALLSLWDHRIATQGEFNPSFHFPILPPSITGLTDNVFRPQYGGPVLPQHRTVEETRVDDRSTEHPTEQQRHTVLAVATEWKSAHGGLSTFNRQLCIALAAAGARVFCTAPEASEADRKDAAAADVTLVRPARMHGGSVSDALSRKPELPPGVEPDIIIGHGRVTGRAAETQHDHFPAARRVHFVHMAPDEIEWFKTDRADDTGVVAEQRTREELNLGREAHRVIAVGPRLYQRYVRDFSAYETATVRRLDPGFDVPGPAVIRKPPPGEPWSILLFGRAEDATLKGLDIAARAVALATADRGPRAPDLELKVRGAPAGTSEELKGKLLEWAGAGGLRPVVRSYSTDGEDLSHDLRTASLVLVPSRAEGFGLVGLEAIQAGTPVLISEQSGLARLLEEVLDEPARARAVVPVTGDLDADGIAWSKAVVGALRDREAAFADAARLRDQLAELRPWSSAAVQLIEDCTLRP